MNEFGSEIIFQKSSATRSSLKECLMSSTPILYLDALITKYNYTYEKGFKYSK
jgi:hypothetical protein